jgi:hypothetical protein
MRTRSWALGFALSARPQLPGRVNHRARGGASGCTSQVSSGLVGLAVDRARPSRARRDLFVGQRIIEGEQVADSAAVIALVLVADVVIFLLLRRAARQGEFRDYEDDAMARLGCTCSWNSGVRTQVDPACPSHGDGSG